MTMMPELFSLGEPCDGYEPDLDNDDPGPDGTRYCSCGWSAAAHGVDAIEAAWSAFHAEHPEVYAKLRELALDLVDRGHRRHLGIAMLWEVMRYYTILGAEPGDDVYRLNNNHKALYARLLMANEPALVDVFETRRRASE